MKIFNSMLLLSLTFACIKTSAQDQPAYKPTYQQLKQYEGVYRYTNNSTLQMAVSPKDTILYALIGDSKYRLNPYRKDVFKNNGNQEISFLRDASGITGYKVNDEHPDTVYKLITKKVTFTDKMWFPRGNVKNFNWQYKQPANLRDGLQTGSMIKSGLDTGLIHTMINRIVNRTYKDIHSILIIKDSKLIVEEYFYDNDVNKLHQLRSASKSFSSAMVGIAIDKHLIKSREEKVLPFYTEYKIGNMDARKASIRIVDMLTQRSGLACDELNQKSPGNELKIYPQHDWVKYVLNLPMIDTPGKTGLYCSGNIFVLNRLVEKVSGMKLHEFAKVNLFDKLGVKNFDWDFVPDETHQDSYSQVYLRSRDMAKFGMLYLNHGRWNGQQIISREYVDESITKHSHVEDLEYGYLWWCEDLTVNGVTYEGAAAKGNGGQRIFIWPKLNMVAVITAGNYNTPSPANKMLMECVLAGLTK